MGITMIIFSVTTIFFAVRGYLGGFLQSLARTVSILLAYIAAFFFAKPVSILVGEHTTLDGIPMYITAGTIVFFAVMGLVRFIFWVISRKKKEDEISTKSRLSGASIGALVGALIGLILVYTFSIYTDAKNRNLDAGIEPSINKTAKTFVSKTAGTIMSLNNSSDTTVKMSEAFLSSPVENADRLSRVTSSPDLQELLNDTRSQHLMKAGDVDELMKVPAFKRLMNDPDMQQLMKNSGFSIDNNDEVRTTAKKLTAGYRSFQLVKDDPRVQNILSDPEFQEQLQSSNKLPLLFNPNLNTLAEIIFLETPENFDILEGNTPKVKYIDDNSYQAGSSSNNGATSVYRSTDKNGNVTYSDKPVRQ